MEGRVIFGVSNKVATISFYHPQSNSLPGEILRKLASTISEAGKNNDVNVIVLKSQGDRAFCAGASFDELASINDLESGKRFFMGFANVINACRKCPKPIIGRVQGKAVGGGVGLAAAVDYCLATKHSAVKLSELAVGIGPFVVGPAVERKIGLSAFSQMSLQPATWYDAKCALEHGLYAGVFDSIETLDAEVAALAQQLAGYSPEAASELKKVFWQGTDHWDDLLEKRAEISGKLVLSDFTKNAIADFKKK